MLPRDCNIDFHGQSKAPTGSGDCVCSSDTLQIGEKCVKAYIFYVSISIGLVAIFVLIGMWYLGYKKCQSDLLWLVNVEELHFSEPVEVIGQGSFGVVLLAEYRGTKVAIKRVLKTDKKKKGGSKNGSVHVRNIGNLFSSHLFIHNRYYYLFFASLYSQSFLFVVFSHHLWEIYSRKDPYEGENPRDVLRKVCDPRKNKRPEIPACCPPKMLDVMKKSWSPDPFLRPHAKDLDLLLMDMNAQEDQPGQEGDVCTFNKPKEITSEDMLYEVFPRHIADALKAGQKVRIEYCCFPILSLIAKCYVYLTTNVLF